MSFTTEVSVTPEQAWAWITSFDDIAKEMSPYLRMSVPSGVSKLSDRFTQPGARMFRSWIKLFGVLPMDYSNLTLVGLTPGVGFVEQSPMGSMKLWRHERTISACAVGSKITDTLTFEPRLASHLVAAIVRAFFAHRHRQLAQHLGQSRK
ncbi:MAG TPA: hypothetical protein VFZ34_32205 [Blastocatellia bacterium]|nr:hypothetical protein [Blastocatellia bacterium]